MLESGVPPDTAGASGADGAIRRAEARVPRSAQGAIFTHDALAVINQSSDEIGQYSVQVATTIQLGKNPLKDAHGRNYVDGYDAGFELQGKRLAFELAKKIRADRQNILLKLGTSQEETTTP